MGDQHEDEGGDEVDEGDGEKDDEDNEGDGKKTMYLDAVRGRLMALKRRSETAKLILRSDYFYCSNTGL